MTQDPFRQKLSEPGIPGSEPEANAEAHVASLKRGLLILIILGIGMLFVTAWFMAKRYWQ